MNKPLHKLVLSVKGKISSGYDPLTGKPFKLVYQRVRKGLGNIETQGRFDLQIRHQAAIIDKKSPAQLQGRARMAAAVLAWQGLAEGDKAVFRERAVNKHMTGFNLFIHQFCNDHLLSEY